MRGDRAKIVCNECGAVVRTVPAAALQQTLNEMELTLDLCTEMCPHCGKVSVFSGIREWMRTPAPNVESKSDRRITMGL